MGRRRGLCDGSAQMAVGLHVTDRGFDCGPAPELAFDDAEHTACLSRDEDAPRVQRITTGRQAQPTRCNGYAISATVGEPCHA